MNQDNHAAPFVSRRIRSKADVRRSDKHRHRRAGQLVRQCLVQAFEPRVLLSGYARSIVASFDPTGGSSPAAAVTFDSAGNLFGTTSGGGPANLGTLFEIPK